MSYSAVQHYFAVAAAEDQNEAYIQAVQAMPQMNCYIVAAFASYLFVKSKQFFSDTYYENVIKK